MSLLLLALVSPVSAGESFVTATEEQALFEEASTEELSTLKRPPSRIPYLACELMGMVWDGRRCVFPPCFPTTVAGDFLRQNANDLAAYHNEVLANDFEVRGDTEITTEDAAEFLTTATDALCADGSCDATEQASYLFEQYGGLLDNSAQKNLLQILQWDVEKGMISEQLGDELKLLAEDADSGLYSGEELQWRIEDLSVGRWDEQDMDAVLTLQAVSRASYQAWGGTTGAKIKPKNVVDGLTTLGCGLLAVATGQLEALPAAGAFGAWGSALYDNFFGRTAAPSTIRWNHVSSPVSFEESVLINDSVYTVQGNLSSKGGAVELRDSEGNLVSERAISTGEKLIDPAALEELSAAAAGRKIYVPVWTPWGWYILVIEIDIKVGAVKL